MGGGISKQQLQVEMTLVDDESKIDILIDHTPNPTTIASPFNNSNTLSPQSSGTTVASPFNDSNTLSPQSSGTKNAHDLKTLLRKQSTSKTTSNPSDSTTTFQPSNSQQRKSFDSSILQSGKHSPEGMSTKTRAKSKSNARVEDIPSSFVTKFTPNTMDDRSTLLTGHKTHNALFSHSSTIRDGELLNFHGDTIIDGKPHLFSALITNMEDMVFIVTDLKNNYYIYETSYPKFLQKFFSGDVTVASLPPYKRHRRMLDMIGLAFSSQTFNITPESVDGSSITYIKIALTLKYKADDIDKTVIFKLCKNLPNLTDPTNSLIHTTFCKIIIGLYGSWHYNRNSKTNTLRQALPSMAIITEDGIVGHNDDEENENSIRSEKSEDDLVNIKESKLEKKEEPTKLSFSEEQSGEQESSNEVKVKKTSINPPGKLVNIDEEPDLITTTEILLFLRKALSILSNRDDIPIDKTKLSLIIKTIAKNSDIAEDDIKDTNSDLEVSAFLNAFVKPTAKSRERAGWKTIANLIRVGIIFKQQTMQTTSKNINAIDSNPGLEEKLKTIDRYDFDVFELNELSRGRPLYVIFTYYLRRFGLMEHFNIEREVLHAFLREVERNYGCNAFHNSIHAADVLQTLMYILDLIGMIPFLSHEELLSIILSAAMHDYQHPGTTNQFQILSSSDLAITYSDKSVLENHHVASLYKVLQQEKYNILKNIPTVQRRQIREMIISLISSTDLSFQGSFMNQLQAVFDVSHGHIDLMTEKSLVLKLCLKLADTANTSKPLHLHFSWISRLQREFFVQGDKEKELGMDVSPFMDRSKCNFTKCQNSFIEYVTYPLVSLFAKCFKEAAPILEYSKLIKEYWANSAPVSTFEEVEQMIRNELAKVNKVVTQSHLGANTSFSTTPRDE